MRIKFGRQTSTIKEIDLTWAKECIEKNMIKFRNFTPETEQILIKFIEQNVTMSERTFPGNFAKAVYGGQEIKNIRESSIKFWIARGYTEAEAKRNISYIQRSKSRRCIEFWTSRGYTEEESAAEIRKHQQKLYKIFKEKHSPEELKQIARINSCWTKEFWIKKGCTEEEAITNVSAKQRKNTLNIDYNKRISHFEKEYFISRGYSEKESKKILSKQSSVTSLDSYISRHGVALGTELYNKRIDGYKNTISNFSMEKRKEINSKISSTMKEIIKNRPYQCQSKSGKKFCMLFYKKARLQGVVKHKENFRCYANGEFYLRGSKGNFYDICINDKYIIEYNGTPWHYDSNFRDELDWFWKNKHFRGNITKETAEYNDKLKAKVAIENGYKFYEVWDFQDKEKRINEIIEEIAEDARNNNI